MVKFDWVSKIYKGDFSALKEVNLEIKDGEFVSIVGQSGAGKSTLLKLIYAEEMPTEGTVYFEGSPTSSINRKKLPLYRRNIGTIFQDFKLLPRKTAYENVAFALEVASVSEEEIAEDVPQILEIVGLGDKMEKYPYQLSMGEQQRVSFARALIHKPKIIIADEPTGNLDSKTGADILNLIESLNRDFKTTVIMVTHEHDVAQRAKTRIYIKDGQAVAKYL